MSENLRGKQADTKFLSPREKETQEQKEKVNLNCGYLLQPTSVSANQLLDMSFVSEYQSAV